MEKYNSWCGKGFIPNAPMVSAVILSYGICSNLRQSRIARPFCQSLPVKESGCTARGALDMGKVRRSCKKQTFAKWIQKNHAFVFHKCLATIFQEVPIQCLFYSIGRCFQIQVILLYFAYTEYKISHIGT